MVSNVVANGRTTTRPGHAPGGRQVIVGFAYRSMTPYILGAAYNGRDLPEPYRNDDCLNNVRVFWSRNDHMVVFDDTEGMEKVGFSPSTHAAATEQCRVIPSWTAVSEQSPVGVMATASLKPSRPCPSCARNTSWKHRIVSMLNRARKRFSSPILRRRSMAAAVPPTRQAWCR